MELAAELVADSRFLERFRRETGFLSRLDHPNCVRVLDYLEIQGRVYLVSEPIEGRTLRQVIGSAELRPAPALALLRAGLVGLEAAHSVDVVHRTLRPESVVLQKDGLVKVTGFGQPAHGAGATLTGAAGISPYAYIAPEQVVGADTDVRTDVYLAGLLGFELLVGRPPFNSADPAEVWSMHMAQDPPRLIDLRPELAPSVAGIVSRALAKAPDDRQQSALEFIAQIDGLRSVLAGTGVEPTVASKLGRRVAPLVVGHPAAVEIPIPIAAGGTGRLGWRRLRALVPGVAALALTLSAAADGYNPSWLGIRGGTRAGQHAASTAQGTTGGSHVFGAQQPSSPPDGGLASPGNVLAPPEPVLSAAPVALPKVLVSPLLLSAVEPAAPQPPAATPTAPPSPGAAPDPTPSPSPLPSPSPSPTPGDESDSPPADAPSDDPEADDAADPVDLGDSADEAGDVLPGDAD
jgi:hypothetical protein